MAEQLSGRELDSAVHRALGFEGKHRCPEGKCEWCGLAFFYQKEPCSGFPAYSTDENLRSTILGEVQRRGLAKVFCQHLDESIEGEWGFPVAVYTLDYDELFRLLSAPIADLCRALLACVEGEGKKLASKVARRWIENPEVLDELAKRLDEMPESWPAEGEPE